MTKGNCLIKECPSRSVLERLSNKWVIMIIYLLSKKPLRFNRLKESVDGISQKVLTSNLKKLEADGIINRKVYDERTLRVEYSITPLGLELKVILNSIKKWAEKNWKTVSRNKEKYDID